MQITTMTQMKLNLSGGQLKKTKKYFGKWLLGKLKKGKQKGAVSKGAFRRIRLFFMGFSPLMTSPFETSSLFYFLNSEIVN
jgi:hypothetical protein